MTPFSRQREIVESLLVDFGNISEFGISFEIRGILKRYSI